jgi:RNA polymerase sigma factor CnrH
LYRIALNLCRDYLRSRAYQYSLQTTSFDAPAEEGGDPSLLLEAGRRPDQRADRREELIALEKAISELPEDLRNAFILSALEDRQQAETAELLGISQKAVETRVYRARKLLLEKMSKMGF